MPSININNRIMYFPGTVPAAGVRIIVYDVDEGGNGDDVIFDRKTSRDGWAKGRSKNWQDVNRVKVRLPTGHVVSQIVPDTPVFMFRAKEGSRDSGRLPFVPGVPIVLPWAPPAPPPSVVKLQVNGQPCSDALDLHKKARAAFENGQSPVRIVIRGPESAPFAPLTGNLNQLRDQVEGMLPGAKQMLYPNPTGAEELLAIAVIILAIGAAVAVNTIATAVAISLILALVLGYSYVKVKMVSGSADNPLPGIELVVSKTPIS